MVGIESQFSIRQLIPLAGKARIENAFTPILARNAGKGDWIGSVVEEEIDATIASMTDSADGLIADEKLLREAKSAAREVADLQQILLPPRLPVTPDWDMSVHYQASSFAGGDFYGFEETGPGSVGIIVADVCGHGPRATVVMAMLRAWLGSFRVYGRPLQMLVTDLNAMLLEVQGLKVFVTAVFFRVDLNDGSFRYVNCGHPSPRLRRDDGRVERLEGGRGLPIGILPDYVVDSPGEGKLEPGESLVFFTDGITEAANRAREFFDDDRLDRSISPGGTCEQIRDRITSAVRDFRAGLPQADDECLLVVRRRKPE